MIIKVLGHLTVHIVNLKMIRYQISCQNVSINSIRDSNYQWVFRDLKLAIWKIFRARPLIYILHFKYSNVQLKFGWIDETQGANDLGKIRTTLRSYEMYTAKNKWFSIVCDLKYRSQWFCESKDSRNWRTAEKELWNKKYTKKSNQVMRVIWDFFTSRL